MITPMELRDGAVTILTIVGACSLVFDRIKHIKASRAWRKKHKGYRRGQRERKRARELAAGDRRPAPIKIAADYAAELKARSIVPALMAGAERIDQMRCAK